MNGSCFMARERVQIFNLVWQLSWAWAGQSASAVGGASHRIAGGFATHVDRSLADIIVFYWLRLEQVHVLGQGVSVAGL